MLDEIMISTRRKVDEKKDGQISGGNGRVILVDERRLGVDDVVDTGVGSERCLDGIEVENGACWLE